MRRWAGQAARQVAREAGRQTRHLGRRGAHILSEILIGLLLLLVVGVGGIAWRLAQGPWELPVLARTLERAAGPGLALSIGHAAIAWEGFAHGGAAPLDIRLSDIAIAGADGTRRLAVPRARVILSVPALLRGRVLVRVLAIDAPALTLTRGKAGHIRIARFGSAGSNTRLDAVLATLASPPGGSGPLAALRRVSLRNGSITFIDEQLGATWNTRHLEVQLRRAASGGATATLSDELVVGKKTVPLHLSGTIPKGYGQTGPGAAQAGPITVAAQLGAIVPADIAGVAPFFAPLAAVHVPVAATGVIRLDAGFAVGTVNLALHVGRGTVDVHGLAEPIADAEALVTGTPRHLAVEIGKLQVAPTGAPMTTLSGHIDARREANGYAVTADASLDRLRFADIAQVWPRGVGGDNTESWLASNITAGEASGGHVQLAAHVAPDFSAVTLSAISGGFTGHDLTIHWLAPIPPVEHVDATLRFDGPDAISITANNGQQAGTGFTVSHASVVISGLDAHDQDAAIAVTLAGPAADLMHILSLPRLNLLARAHLALHGVAGAIAGTLKIPRLPLLARLKADDIKVEATGTTNDLRLAGLVAGRNLDSGDLSFSVSNDGLSLSGRAALAGIASQVKAAMDFRAGPPTEITQSATVAATTSAASLATAGLDTGGTLTGPVGVQATWQQQRGGAGSLAVNANLGAATLTVPGLGWTKAAGTPATAQGRLQLAGDRITAISGLSLRGTGIDVTGRLAFAGGMPRLLVLDRLLWEPGTDASLSLIFPQANHGAWDIALSGKRFDVSALLTPAKGPPKPQPPADRKQPKRGPVWTASVTLDRLVTGAGLGVDTISARASNDGLRLTSLNAAGEAGTAAFSAAISRQGAGYAMHLAAADTGALLVATDTTRSLVGGRLDVTATDPGTTPLADWSGTATMHGFSVRDQPVLGKLLQAMTLYGVLDALRGQGVAFDTLIAPFRYRGDILTLRDARAFSSSLGMTAKGSIDFATDSCDVQGTLVPAYFFNTLLGRMPFIGRLFSPEKGGGLFAATYGVSGGCNDPSVGVNPLAALTPGFLRGVFGIFDTPAVPARPAAPKTAPAPPTTPQPASPAAPGAIVRMSPAGNG